MKTKNGILTKSITIISVLGWLSSHAIAGNGTQGPCAEIKDSEANKVCLSVQTSNPDSSISFNKLLKVQGKCATIMAKSFIDKLYSSDPAYVGRAQIKSQKTVDGIPDADAAKSLNGNERIDFYGFEQTLQTYTTMETNEGCRFTLKLSARYSMVDHFPYGANIGFVADMTTCEVANGENGLVDRIFA